MNKATIIIKAIDIFEQEAVLKDLKPILDKVCGDVVIIRERLKNDK